AIDGAYRREDRLIIELDTPGGDVKTMWSIAKLIDRGSREGVLTIAWVNPHALSAGALLALACDAIYMRSQGSIGSAAPIRFGPTGIDGDDPDEVVDEKGDSSLRADFRGWAEAHGRSPVLAEAMVDIKLHVRLVKVDGVQRVVSNKEWNDLRQRGDDTELVRTICTETKLLNLTGSEAVELGMADGLAESLDEVIDKTGSRGTVTYVVRSRSEDLAALLYRMGPWLLVLGLILGYAELKAPGFGIPGFLSICCFAVMLFGRYLVGLADIPHIVLISIGVLLLAIELFLVPGTIWVGLVGGILVVGGLVWSGIGTGLGFEYELDRRIAMDSATDVVLSCFAAMVGVWLLARLLPDTPALGWLRLRTRDQKPSFASAMQEAEGGHAAIARTGARGRALTALRPVGKVALDEDPSLDFEARSSGPGLDVGAAVRVVEVRSGRLVVEPDVEAEAQEGS
ncbi:MAG: hypothetical protein O7B99_13170, partial [Planctomycetota bacterium]|nr:hypothetical protein [Planctomycetota bacterium]